MGVCGLLAMFSLLLQLFAWQPAAAEEPSVLELGASSSYRLSGHMSIFSDPSARISFDEILASPGRFKPLGGNLAQGYRRESVWLRFRVRRTTGFDGMPVLRLFPSYLDNVDVYVQNPELDASKASSYREFRLGDHIPVTERVFPDPTFTTDIAAPLDLQPGSMSTIYLRLRTSSAMNLMGAVESARGFESYSRNSLIFSSGCLSIVFVVFLINLLYFFRNRDRLYLYSSLYMFALSINYVGTSGLLSLFAPRWAHLLSDYFVGFGMGLGLSAMALITRKLFSALNCIWIYRFLFLSVTVGLLTILSVPFDVFSSVAPVACVDSVLLILLLAGLSIHAVRRGDHAGMLYLVVFGFGNIGYVLQYLSLLGLLPMEEWNSGAAQVAGLFNVLLLLLLVSERLRDAEHRLVSAIRDSERNALDLASRLTADLESSKSHLEVALASEQLALKRQKLFLSMVSHEYRTPLAIIVGNLDIIEIDREDGKSMRHQKELGYIRRAAGRLLEIMEVSLERSRLADPKAQEVFRLLDVGQFMNTLLEEVRHLWMDRKFSFVGPPRQLHVFGDMKHISTALFNLLDNARKYSPSGSEIKVECRQHGGEVLFSVRNPSSGFKLDDIEEMFEKYRRGVTSSGTGGAGVGLWLVRRIAEQHGGTATLSVHDSIVDAQLRLPVARSHD